MSQNGNGHLGIPQHHLNRYMHPAYWWIPSSHCSNRLIVGRDSSPSPETSNTPSIPDSDAQCIHTKPAEREVLLKEKVQPRGWTPPGAISRSVFLLSGRNVSLVGRTTQSSWHGCFSTMIFLLGSTIWTWHGQTLPRCVW